jgi:2-polyprenyl-3-methyl-5-hydroxy-6-metoxy-1,4-benzoquinol methylase
LGRKLKETIIKANSIVLKKQSNKITVLDIGCGYGEILSDIAGGLKVGVDVNTEAIKRANQRAKSAFFILCDIGKLPFKPKTFDFVIRSEVFDHMDGLSILANQIVEATKYGGFLTK